VDCPPDLAPIYVDREMWEKIVLNLLSNAFKFTFEGEIAVTLRPVGNEVELTVRDTGVGIPPEELPHVFERFHRVLGARARTHEGTGIGLALVQELAKLHGGAVRVTSEGGRGSAFSVTIPYGTAHLPAGRIGAARTLVSTATGAAPFVEEAERWVSDEVPADAAPPTVASRVSHARILLADDNADMRDYLRRLLGQYWTVESVADGHAALDAARARRPDLVLADVMMPRLDGLGLLRALRGDPATASIPVVLLSARAGEESRVEGIEAGADDYLVKPLSARELIARVNTHLELARVRRAAQVEVQDAHERLEAALETGRMIAWDWDLTSGIVSRSRTAPQFLGLAVQGEPRAFYDLVEPDDRPLVDSRIAAAITHGAPYEVEFRVRMPDGEARWLGERGRVRRDGDGRPVRFVGVTFDFTERKQIEAALRGSEARLLDDLAAMTKLQEVSTRLVQTSDPAALLLEIVDAAIAVTGADMGNIQLLDHASDRLRIVASRGFDGPFLEFFDTVQGGHAGGGMAMETRERIGVEDVDDSPLFRDSPALDVLHTAGVRSLQATPLFDRSGRVVGVLSTHYRVPRRLADRDRRLVDLLARQAADLIERANAEQVLLEADRAKDEFLAMLGHELRNPLGAIANAVAVLNQIGSPDARLVQLRAIITRQAQQLTRLVDDLLDVSRLVAGKMDLRREPVNLEALAKQCLSTIARPERLRERGLTLEAQPAWVEGDPARLEQVLTNLIDNALKYTPQGGRISVTIRSEGPEAVIRVRDTGVGIAPELLPRIFDVFVQARQKPHRAEGGLGLGLTLVKRLVEMQRGTVRVASDGPGLGAEFIVRLPLLAHAGDRPPAPSQEPQRPPERQRVLIVEDHVDSRESLRLLLEASGHHVEEAVDGPTGLARLEALRPDVAFVDVGLPEMDGYAVARAVRASPTLKGVFLVALTGYGDPKHRREAAVAGFDAHVVKPVTLERLLDVLARTSRRGPGPAAARAIKVRRPRRIRDGT
jgi:PAS domain S-box-containing protein